jgi:2-C-methyl-D-erythritol 4-phosphate cytidylyltransferase
MEPFAIILPAAGRSIRFGGSRGKLLELLAGEPVLRHSVRAFLCRQDVGQIIIAAPAEERAALSSAIGEETTDSRVRFCAGGENRAQSVRNALRQVSADLKWVAVHDAARPLVSQEIIERTFAAAEAHGAAVPAMPVALTIKQATGPLPARVERTVPRQTLWAMQTPQAMRRDDLLAAFASCPLSLDQVTDDVQLLELAGKEVWLVAGEEQNLKITTPIDLQIAEMILANKGG